MEQQLTAWEKGEAATGSRMANSKNPFSPEYDAVKHEQWSMGYQYASLMKMKEAMGTKHKMKFKGTNSDISIKAQMGALLKQKRRND